MYRKGLLATALILAASGCSSPSSSLPRLSITTVVLPPAEVGAAYSVTLQAAGGDESYTWNVGSGVLPPGLSLSGSSGMISGTPANQGSFPLTVIVRSGDGQTASASLTLEIAWPPLTVTTGSLPAAEVGTPYSASLTADGGDGAYVWSLLSGSLPSGLTLEASGIIEGTVLEAGVSSFTAQVASGDGQVSSSTLDVSASGPLEGLTALIPGSSIGEFYSFQLEASGGDGVSYVWSLVEGDLPPGVSLAPDGVLFGSPTTTGIFSFVAEASSADLRSTTGLTLTVSGAPSSDYNITVHWVSEGQPAPVARGPARAALIDPAVRTAMELAIGRWEEAIRGDLGGGLVPEGTFSESACDGNGSLVNGGVFFDLTLLVSVEPIDGPFGTLAQAGACVIRGNQLPIVGVVTFDSADLVPQLSELMEEIALHEIGHAMGFSGGFFEDLGLAAGLGTETPRYTGANGVAQYKTFGGCCDEIDLEETGGPGTADSHWDELTHGTELMTPQIAASNNPLSVMTLGALMDIGYTVDLEAASPYTCPGACSAPPDGSPGSLSSVQVGSDVLRMPRFVLGSDGAIERVIHP